jgi:hypothetical protein
MTTLGKRSSVSMPSRYERVFSSKRSPNSPEGLPQYVRGYAIDRIVRSIRTRHRRSQGDREDMQSAGGVSGARPDCVGAWKGPREYGGT